jgi:hypothetical protein
MGNKTLPTITEEEAFANGYVLGVHCCPIHGREWRWGSFALTDDGAASPAIKETYKSKGRALTQLAAILAARDV